MLSTIGFWVIVIIIAVGLILILRAFLASQGVAIPPLLITIFWIIVGVVVCILAVKLILGVVAASIVPLLFWAA